MANAGFELGNFTVYDSVGELYDRWVTSDGTAVAGNTSVQNHYMNVKSEKYFHFYV